MKHLEEIREAGLDVPTVNQIEVRYPQPPLVSSAGQRFERPQLHPLCQQRPIVEYCKQHNIVVQAYTPLIRGRWDEPVFKQIADKHGKDIAQVLIRWSLQKGCALAIYL